MVPCLDVIMIAFFPRNIQWSSLFARKARVNTERVPPGHPIILLKSSKFNMAPVSVKRSIITCLCHVMWLNSNSIFLRAYSLGMESTICLCARMLVLEWKKKSFYIEKLNSKTVHQYGVSTECSTKVRETFRQITQKLWATKTWDLDNWKSHHVKYCRTVTER